MRYIAMMIGCALVCMASDIEAKQSHKWETSFQLVSVEDGMQTTYRTDVDQSVSLNNKYSWVCHTTHVNVQDNTDVVGGFECWRTPLNTNDLTPDLVVQAVCSGNKAGSNKQSASVFDVQNHSEVRLEVSCKTVWK